MKKITDKFVKILMLVSMIFSSFQTPIQVFAKEIANRDSEIPVGSIKLGENGKIEESGIASTTKVENGISITKTVSKTDTLGKYHVKFELKGTSTEVNKPVYVVVVFDRSGSMGMGSCEWGTCYNMEKWNNAVKGAQTFVNTLINDKTGLKDAKVALVTFAETATNDRDFKHEGLATSDFGSPNEGTNLHDGLVKAGEYFSTIPEEDQAKALKYIVVMSDGKPTYYDYTGRDGKLHVGGTGIGTSSDILDATFKEADSLKKNGITIFSLGYGIDEDEVALGGRYVYNKVNYWNIKTKQVLELVASSKDNYYSASNESEIVGVFSSLASDMIYAGKNAILKDTVGKDFRVVNADETTSDYGIVKSSDTISVIPDKATTILEFDIEINQDASTGWHQTNDGFRLEYIDNNGVKQTINSEEDPYVYWKQKTYQYKVSYYKDSFENAPFETDTRYATNGTVINIDNVEKDKYLSEAGARYEFNRIDPASITITNDGEVKKIKVLYTAEGTVIARYKDTDGVVLAQEETTTGIVGTDYTTNSKNIYGYTLVSEPTNKNGVYTYNKNNEPIYVDYIYTKNEGALEINDVIKTQINKITGANSTFKYILSYNGKLDNYVGVANLTLVDTLPYDVASIEYDESICSYDSATRKLTCNKKVEITKDNKDTILNTQIEVIVKYNKLTSTTDLEVKNIVDSKLVYGDKSALDNDDVIDTIKSSKVVTIYVDEDDNELASSEEMTGLIDNEYTTEEKDILGYTLKEVPSNKDGLYTEEEIIVKYVYTKNIGTSEEEVKKVGLEEVTSINDAFIYTITYNAVVKDYVGDVKLVITDKLPYEIDEEKSVIDTNNDNITCKYIDSKIVCEYNKTIDSEEDNTIDVVINLELYFKNVNSDMVVNKVEAELTYGDVRKPSKDETGTKVLSGTVIVNYVTEDGEELAPSEEMTGLVGEDYKTTKKAFDKYYLKEVKGNETGVYAEDTQEVTYVYSLIPLPPQTGYEGNNTNYIGLFILGIVMLLFKKKI